MPARHRGTRRRPRRRSRPRGGRNAADRRRPRAPRHPMAPGRARGAASSMTSWSSCMPSSGRWAQEAFTSHGFPPSDGRREALGAPLFRTASRGRAALPDASSAVSAPKGHTTLFQSVSPARLGLAPTPARRMRVGASPDARTRRTPTRAHALGQASALACICARRASQR